MQPEPLGTVGGIWKNGFAGLEDWQRSMELRDGKLYTLQLRRRLGDVWKSRNTTSFFVFFFHKTIGSKHEKTMKGGDTTMNSMTPRPLRSQADRSLKTTGIGEKVRTPPYDMRVRPLLRRVHGSMSFWVIFIIDLYQHLT